MIVRFFTHSPPIFFGVRIQGADGSLKHPTTSKLAVSQLLTPVKEGTVPTVRWSVLSVLLRAGRLEFDDALGDILKKKTQFIKCVAVTLPLISIGHLATLIRYQSVLTDLHRLPCTDVYFSKPLTPLHYCH